MLTEEQIEQARIATRNWSTVSTLPFARAIEAAAAAPLLERIAALEKLSVTNIMLSISPGWDGMGEEVYAKSVADVEDKLGKMGEELEDWQLGIKRHPEMEAHIAALDAKLAQRVPDGRLHDDGYFTRNSKRHPNGQRPVQLPTDFWLSAAPAAPEQQDQSAQHLDMVAQAPNAQQAEAQEPCAWHVVHRGSAQIFTSVDSFDPTDCIVTPLFTRPQPAQPHIQSGEPSESAGMPIPAVIHYPPPQSVWLFPQPKGQP